ncbi:MAG: TlyA family RNA methyltransferase [Chloroflexi bacterium]|nr:TlyA family RNA methyltransferase [Chloroflexota bacterium]
MTIPAARVRVRLDDLLVARGLADSRAKAGALLIAGQVRVGEGDAARTDRKPGDQVPSEIAIAVRQSPPYVSRGGLKLAAALERFGIAAQGRVCLDVGASTGGFTDVLLERGAMRVYAIEVGRGQLADRLRRDPRVVSLERTNARSLQRGSLPEPIEVATIDVAFVSLTVIVGPVSSVLRQEGADAVALVKPQFEAPRDVVVGGVVRDPDVHRAMLGRVAGAARAEGYSVRDACPSPILGPEGNREFFLHLAWGASAGADADDLEARLDAAAEPAAQPAAEPA